MWLYVVYSLQPQAKVDSKKGDFLILVPKPKCGFGGDEFPRSIFPTVVGRLRFPDSSAGQARKDVYVGDEATGKGTLAVKRPIEFGVITSFDDIEENLPSCNV